jgi:branched-chain amino acid transport system ATP-binding protein
MLEVRELHVGYGRIPILNGVNLSVVRGSRVGILGHNGMGKTTLMRALMGLLPVKSGKVVFETATITSVQPHLRARSGIAYVPQGRQIFSQLTVRDNLRMGALRAPDGTMERVLDRIPRLKRLLDRPGGALSGGEQQLLAIARALCGKPKLMLLDEPTEGIQPSIIEEISELLIMLNESESLAIIVVEQNLEFIAGLARRIAVLQKGLIVREVAPADLHDEQFIEEFVGMGN